MLEGNFAASPLACPEKVAEEERADKTHAPTPFAADCKKVSGVEKRGVLGPSLTAPLELKGETKETFLAQPSQATAPSAPLPASRPCGVRLLLRESSPFGDLVPVPPEACKAEAAESSADLAAVTSSFDGSCGP